MEYTKIIASMLEVVIRRKKRRRQYKYNKNHMKKLKKILKALGGRYTLDDILEAEPHWRYVGDQLHVSTQWPDKVMLFLLTGVFGLASCIAFVCALLHVFGLTSPTVEAGIAVSAALGLVFCGLVRWLCHSVWISRCVETRLARLGKPLVY